VATTTPLASAAGDGGDSSISGGQNNHTTGFVDSILGGANETLGTDGGSSEAGPTVFGP
jgi:hypothetical protein